MPIFKYSAFSAEGALSHGELDARTRQEAFRRLAELKLRPVEIISQDGPLPSVSDHGETFAKLPRLNSKRLLQFTEELADLLEAGLQLEPALRVIENRKENSPIKAVAGYLRQRIREGKSFSSALRECPESFSELFVNVVAAGEAAGALENIIRRQVQYIALVIDLQKRVAMALIYPAIVFTAGIVLMMIFMMFLLPQLTVLLSKTGKELPLVTKMLIGTGEFLGHYWWALILAFILIYFAHRVWIATPSGRKTWDRVILKIPFLGTVLKQQFLAQFLQTLSTLVSNGVVLLNALVLVRNATKNTHIKNILEEISRQVGEGVSLSRCLEKSGFFPPVLIDIIGVGEQSGKIAVAMQRGAARYDKEFNAHIQRLTILIQPVTILVVAIFVGVIAYSMITGILTTVSGLRMR